MILTLPYSVPNSGSGVLVCRRPSSSVQLLGPILQVLSIRRSFKFVVLKDGPGQRYLPLSSQGRGACAVASSPRLSPQLFEHSGRDTEYLKEHQPPRRFILHLPLRMRLSPGLRALNSARTAAVVRMARPKITLYVDTVSPFAYEAYYVLRVRWFCL